MFYSTLGSGQLALKDCCILISKTSIDNKKDPPYSPRHKLRFKGIHRMWLSGFAVLNNCCTGDIRKKWPRSSHFL